MDRDKWYKNNTPFYVIEGKIFIEDKDTFFKKWAEEERMLASILYCPYSDECKRAFFNKGKCIEHAKLHHANRVAAQGPKEPLEAEASRESLEAQASREPVDTHEPQELMEAQEPQESIEAEEQQNHVEALEPQDPVKAPGEPAESFAKQLQQGLRNGNFKGLQEPMFDRGKIGSDTGAQIVSIVPSNAKDFFKCFDVLRSKLGNGRNATTSSSSKVPEFLDSKKDDN